jgi:hypothetical protein
MTNKEKVLKCHLFSFPDPTTSLFIIYFPGLILKCQYWTMCSRLMAQILAILTISFSSLEVHYVGDGTVLLWFRRIKEKERLNTCVILQTIYRKLSTEEVLECFPFHQLVENNWLTVLLRTFNDFMAESIIRAIVHFKHE